MSSLCIVLLPFFIAEFVARCKFDYSLFESMYRWYCSNKTSRIDTTGELAGEILRRVAVAEVPNLRRTSAPVPGSEEAIEAFKRARESTRRYSREAEQWNRFEFHGEVKEGEFVSLS